MNPEVIITCAVTGAGDTQNKQPDLPITPAQIAAAFIEAAAADAAVVYIHVRDPATSQGSRDTALHAEVVERVQASGCNVILNLTCGMGSELYVNDNDPRRMDSGRDIVNAITRFQHVTELRPELYTLDCGSMNFGDGNSLMVHTHNMLREMAARVRALVIKPAIEVFDSGQFWFDKQMCDERLIDGLPLFQLCLSIPCGAPANTETMAHLIGQLPPGAVWAGFGISSMQMPMVSQAISSVGRVRVALEDNLYLKGGVLASNGQLVEKAVAILTALGARPVSPAEELAKLGLAHQ